MHPLALVKVVLATDAAVWLYRTDPVVPSARVGDEDVPPEASAENAMPPAAQPVPDTSEVFAQFGVVDEKLIGAVPSVRELLCRASFPVVSSHGPVPAVLPVSVTDLNRSMTACTYSPDLVQAIAT